MGILENINAFNTIGVEISGDVFHIRIDRPEFNNTINAELVTEITEVLGLCEAQAKIVVLEGQPDIFCMGADFGEIQQSFENNVVSHQDPDPLYGVWTKLATGPFISIAKVRGRVNAGGVGFVAACDIALADSSAVFSLSELLFGLYPACVLPFLVNRMGKAKANYMTLMTQPVSAVQARDWGLVDQVEDSADNLLRKHLLRLKRLSRQGVADYKSYMAGLGESMRSARPAAVAANSAMFSDPEKVEKIARYVKTGRFPWETES